MKKILAIGATMLFAMPTFAAVDTDVSSAASTVANTLKENAVGVISSNVSTIILAGVLVLAITLMWRLTKRFLRG